MRLLRAQILSFRRFVDLTIEDVPSTARLVVLVGPNGSGKTSFFDALLLRYRQDGGYGWNNDPKYYDRPQSPTSETSGRVSILTTAGAGFGRGSLYVRTAYRNDSEFVTNSLKRQGELLDRLSLQRMIEPDATVSSNYQHLASRAMEDVFVNEAASTTLGDYREKLIGEVREPLRRLFPDLTFVGIGNPLEQGTFQFDKGLSKGFDYKNLSGGEKASFDLLLDMIVKRRAFRDAIYCIDEPEAHMNTRLQGALLSELVGLLPGDSQLWIASHSIGMMRRAREMHDSDPSSVAFIDFSEQDFDEAVSLAPSKPTRRFWERVMRVALDDLSTLIAPELVVVCEGNPAGLVAGKNSDHDAKIYDAIFADEMPRATFTSGGSSKEVQGDFIGLAAILPRLVSGVKVLRLIDRDDHAADDVLNHQRQGIRVLRRRHLECYLYDDEVLTALCASVERPEMAPDLLAAKAKALAHSVSLGYPADDVKKVAGQVYNDAKRILSLTQVGNDSFAFARNTLSKLIKPGMLTYEELKADVFDT